MNASDFNVNGAWIKQALDGKFIFQNPFTSEQQKPFLVRPFYVAISFPFRWIDMSPADIIHIWRTIFSFILLIVLFPLIQVFEKDSRRVNLAFLLLAFTSGVGYFLRHLVPESADLGIPEAFLFLTMGEAPHFQYSILLFYTGMASLFLISENRKGAVWLFLVCLELLWWDHPFDAVSLSALSLMALWFFPNLRKKVVFFALIALFSAPPILYYFWLRTLPYAQGAAQQNLMPSPTPAAMLTAFLPIALFAIIGAKVLLKSPTQKRTAQFLIAWIVIQLILAYIPVAFQRRLISGVHFPLAILAAAALNDKVRKSIFIGSLIILLSATNLFLIKTQIQELKSRNMPFYLPDSYKYAFTWLSYQSEKAAVLSGFTTANFVPAYSGLPAYWGHSAFSPRIAEKRQDVENFYRSPNLNFVKINRIRYIFLALEERQYGLRKLDAPFFLIYNREGIRIYQPGGVGVVYNGGK